jgi:hypothetical protein
MIVNLVAYPKDASSALIMRNQNDPLPNIKNVQTTIVLLVPGLSAEPPTPAEIAAAVWARVGRTLTA